MPVVSYPSYTILWLFTLYIIRPMSCISISQLLCFDYKSSIMCHAMSYIYVGVMSNYATITYMISSANHFIIMLFMFWYDLEYNLQRLGPLSLIIRSPVCCTRWYSWPDLTSSCVLVYLMRSITNQNPKNLPPGSFLQNIMSIPNF